MKATTIKSSKDTREDIGWRHFPQFEELMAQEKSSPFLSKVEKTCRQLNDALQSGSQAERTRANLAMTAYGRSLDLLRVLTEMRDKAVREK